MVVRWPQAYSFPQEVFADLALRKLIDTLIVVDGDLVVQYADFPAALYYRSPRSILHHPLTKLFPASLYAGFYRHLKEVIATGQAWEGEYPIQQGETPAALKQTVRIFPLSPAKAEAPMHYAIVGYTPCRQLYALDHEYRIYMEIVHALRGAQSSREVVVAFARKVRDILGIKNLAVGLRCAMPEEEEAASEEEAHCLTIVYASDAWRSLLGKTIHCEALFQEEIEKVISPQDLCDEQVEPVLLEGGQVLTAALLMPKEGEVDGVALIGTPAPLSAAQRNTFHILASVTARALHRQRLHERLEAKIEALQQAQDELIRTEKMASLGILLAGVAHEINNPLTSIILYTQEALEKEADAAVREDLETVLKLAHRAAEVIRNMLSFSAHAPARPEAIAIAPLIEQTLQMIRHELQTREIKVVVDIPDDLPPVWVSEVELQQVFLNLLINAAYAIEEKQQQSGTPVRGEIRIDAHIHPGEDEPFVHVLITDNGKGIAKDHLRHIFDPFFTTREPGRGTGLGLAIVHSIVTRYGGRVKVESTVGEGAAFCVALPIAQDETSNARPRPKRDPTGALAHPPGHYRILVVDDEVNIRRIFERLLQREGYHTESVADGAAAYEAILARDYDLVLCDVNIPKITGDQLYAKLAEAKPHMLPRMVFITGDTHNQRVKAFMESSRAVFLTKPFGTQEFLQVVHDTLAALE